MKKTLLFLSLIIVFTLSGCTTSNEVNEKSAYSQENIEPNTYNHKNNLESSISSMQEQIDILNDKLDDATETTTTRMPQVIIPSSTSSNTTTTLETYVVPDVVGMTVDEAKDILSKELFYVTIGFNQSKDNYIVTSTSPPAGTVVTRYSTVMVNSEPPQENTLPSSEPTATSSQSDLTQ